MNNSLKDLPKEERRILALRKYEILDTPADGSFDDLTGLAAKVFNVPIAIVSLVDVDRIWFKSHHGLEIEQIDRNPGLCALAILSDDVYLVEDAKHVSALPCQSLGRRRIWLAVLCRSSTANGRWEHRDVLHFG